MTSAHALRLAAGLTPSMLRVVREIRQKGVPNRILLFGESLGDNLLLAAVCRELRKRGTDRIWVLSPCPEFFGEFDVSNVFPIAEVAIRFLWRAGLTVRPEAIGFGVASDSVAGRGRGVSEEAKIGGLELRGSVPRRVRTPTDAPNRQLTSLKLAEFPSYIGF
jgi:hypothetical protein